MLHVFGHDIHVHDMASPTATHTPPSQVVHFDSTSNASHGRSHSSSSRRTTWPARRHTPYTKTPKSRRLHGKSSRLERTPVVPAGDSHALKQLTNKTWHVYQVTPLNNFQHSVAALRKYSRHLSATLQAIGITGYDNDPEAVELTIKSRGQGRGANAKVIFNAIFCCVGWEHRGQLAEGLTMLPVLLVKGTAAVTRFVLSWLQVQFDCHVKKMTFNPVALVWMVSMWAGLSTGEKSKTVELLYTVPKTVEGLSRITMTIDATDAKILWDSVHDEGSADFTADEVTAFIKALEAHFFHHFKIHLAALTLSRIGTPIVYIGSEGRLKILSQEGTRAVLQHITELAVDNFCRTT
ncbi:centromere protein L-like [Acanthaster planci]|uniref:Centromere protein L n=1 Tax=Acanthaster planci TaxID=133434 RepID=A0A8B7XR48_ACAPL|nr:centromere protein L-like [Acanthaster planci]